MMTLHGYYRSSAAFRVRIALNLKGIAHEKLFHHLRRNEQSAAGYLALNPQGLVPALEAPAGVLTQSMAIIEYLDETMPNPPLLPADALGRARVRALAQIIACDIHPIDNLRVLRYLRDPLGQDEAAVQAWYNHWIIAGFGAFEALVAGKAGMFCHGDTPGLADVCLVPQVVNAGTYKLDLSPYPTIQRVFAAAMERPEFIDALPVNQPDAE